MVLRELARIAFNDMANVATLGADGLRLKDKADLDPEVVEPENFRLKRWFTWSLDPKRLHYISKLYKTPTWTLVLTGPRRREWGYTDRAGQWVHYQEHECGKLFDDAMAWRDANGYYSGGNNSEKGV